jgi:hypothetical protein
MVREFSEFFSASHLAIELKVPAFSRLRQANPEFFAESGWLLPERRYLKKNSTGHCSGLIFEGYTLEALAEFLIPTK